MQQDWIGNLVLPDCILYGGKISCDNGKIKNIESSKTSETSALPYIFPGLIDIHNHGALSHDYMESGEESFSIISGYLASHGITTAQATTVSAPVNEIVNFLNSYRNWQRNPSNPSGCRFCGIHIEGPYISPASRGAHQLDTLLTPSDGFSWLLENNDIIREITVAPELEGMPEMIAALKKAGIVVSGGHDSSEPEDILKAVQNGMSHCTHIYCAMSTLHKTGMQRYSGLCEYAMTHNNITAEMIADNHHIPPTLAKMIYRCKGADRLCLVSDAIAPSGLKESNQIYSLGAGKNTTKVFVEDGVAIVEDRSCYAGSVQPIDRMIRNMVRNANIPLVDAVRMASLTPATVIGIQEECGSIEVGKRADFCIVNSQLEVVQTVIAGSTVYRKDESFESAD